MCDPVSLTVAAASAAASAGGAYMNASGQNANQAAAIRAKNAGGQALAEQNGALTRESQGVFQNVLGPFNNAGAGLSGAQGRDTAAFNANAPTAAMISGGATTGNAPRVVTQDANASIANRMSKIAASNGAFGNLAGYDTAMGDNARTIHSGGDQLGTISDFAKQNANTNAAVTNANITNSQKPPSPFADLLSGLGAIGSFYAGKGMK